MKKEFINSVVRIIKCEGNIICSSPEGFNEELGKQDPGGGKENGFAPSRSVFGDSEF